MLVLVLVLGRDSQTAVSGGQAKDASYDTNFEHEHEHEYENTSPNFRIRPLNSLLLTELSLSLPIFPLESHYIAEYARCQWIGNPTPNRAVHSA